MIELSEAVEMATLDKEMAEEKVAADQIFIGRKIMEQFFRTNSFVTHVLY